MLDSRLRHVVAVARCGSITAAAQAVGLTQSAVTRSIADLEREVGYAIFYRTSRGVILTEAGRGFVEGAARLLEDASELLRRGRERKNPYAGTLRIGVGPASLEWTLLKPLEDLLTDHPDIRYDINSSSFESIVQQLRSGTIDVAIGFDAAFSEWSDIRREAIGSLNTTLFVRNGHPLLDSVAPSLADLARYIFVSPADSRPYGEIIRNIYHAHGADWADHVHIVDYFPAVMRIVQRSDAIGVISTPNADRSTFRRRFALLGRFEPWVPSPLCCAVRARWDPKPAARAFIAAIKRANGMA